MMTCMLWRMVTMTMVMVVAMMLVVHAAKRVTTTLLLPMGEGRQGRMEDNIRIILRRRLAFAVLWHLLFQAAI